MPTDPHRAPRKQSLRGWNLGGVVYRPKPWRRVVYQELRVTSTPTAVIAKEYEQR